MPRDYLKQAEVEREKREKELARQERVKRLEEEKLTRELKNLRREQRNRTLGNIKTGAGYAAKPITVPIKFVADKLKQRVETEQPSKHPFLKFFGILLFIIFLIFFIRLMVTGDIQVAADFIVVGFEKAGKVLSSPGQFIKTLYYKPYEAFEDIQSWKNPYAEYKEPKKKKGIEVEVLEGDKVYFDEDEAIIMYYDVKIKNIEGDADLTLNCSLEGYKEGIEIRIPEFVQGGFIEAPADSDKGVEFNKEELFKLKLTGLKESDSANFNVQCKFKNGLNLGDEPDEKQVISKRANFRVGFNVKDTTVLRLYILQKELYKKYGMGDAFFEAFGLDDVLKNTGIWAGDGKLASYSPEEERGPMVLKLQTRNKQPFTEGSVVYLAFGLEEGSIFDWEGELSKLNGLKFEYKSNFLEINNIGCRYYSDGNLENDVIRKINKEMCSKTEFNEKCNFRKDKLILPSCEFKVKSEPERPSTFTLVMGNIDYDYEVVDDTIVKIRRKENPFKDQGDLFE